MVLSSWQRHCESSPGSFDEYRTAPIQRKKAVSPPVQAAIVYTHHDTAASVTTGDILVSNINTANLLFDLASDHGCCQPSSIVVTQQVLSKLGTAPAVFLMLSVTIIFTFLIIIIIIITVAHSKPS